MTRGRGVVLLEVLLAVALFVVGGLVILNIADDGVRRLERAREGARAADLARSAMALIESGLAVPGTLHGPVRDPGLLAGFEPTGPGEEGWGGWTLDITTEPAPFAGLTRVSIGVLRADATGAAGPGEPAPLYTLVQLVDLSGAGPGWASSGEAGATVGAGGGL